MTYTRSEYESVYLYNIHKYVCCICLFSHVVPARRRDNPPRVWVEINSGPHIHSQHVHNLKERTHIRTVLSKQTRLKTGALRPCRAVVALLCVVCVSACVFRNEAQSSTTVATARENTVRSRIDRHRRRRRVVYNNKFCLVHAPRRKYTYTHARTTHIIRSWIFKCVLLPSSLPVARCERRHCCHDVRV